jgi:hypothetical protein
MADFPSIRPSQRSLTMGELPIKEYRALNGATVRRSFGNQRFAYQLSLTFDNIPETSLSELWDHYHDNQTVNGFSLPDDIFGGYGAKYASDRGQNFILRANRMTNIIWRYAEPPQIESVTTSYSTVQLTLIGELRYSPTA